VSSSEVLNSRPTIQRQRVDVNLVVLAAFGMAPVASSLASKLKLWVVIDDAFTTDGKVVICQVCDENIGCTMKSQLEQHNKCSSYKTNNCSVPRGKYV
jgi:hypothetical protein